MLKYVQTFLAVKILGELPLLHCQIFARFCLTDGLLLTRSPIAVELLGMH